MNETKFGQFEFNLESGGLRKNGELVKLQAQPAKVLGMLVIRAGTLVTRQDLQQAVWGENFVEFDQGLNFCIRQIRVALGDEAESPVFIETVPRQGYRFIAPVVQAENAVPAVEPVSLAVTSRPLPRRRLVKNAAIALLVVLLMGVALVLLERSRQSAPPAIDRKMLAVLPFDNFTADPDQEYFCDGLTEELITALSRLNPGKLGVIARTSAMRYKTEKKPVSQIKSELGVDFLIEGSVRNEGGQLRISVQLIRTSDQSHLWALNFDRPQLHSLSVQREVSESVAHSLSLELVPRGGPKRASHNVQAREAYLKGRHQLKKRTQNSVKQAIAFFQAAIGFDPGFAEAHVGLAAALREQYINPREMLPQARSSLRHALGLDESLAEAHCLSGELAMRVELDWPLARHEFERALELEPGRAETHHELAFYYSNLGQHDEAIARLQRVLELDPVSPLVKGDLGWLYLRARRYDEAIGVALKTLEIEPKDIGAHYCLLQVLRLQGKKEEAARKAREVMELGGATSHELAELDAGDVEKRLTAYSHWELKTLLDSGKRGYLDPAVLAMSYADLGESEKAIEALSQAEREGSGFLSSLRSEPRFDPLRKDPRFVALLTRLFRAV